MLLSKSLGYAIVAGSIFVKIPQVLKLLANRSAAGINLFAVLLEITAITLNLAYSFVKGFPFSAWGDASFLAVLNCFSKNVCIKILIQNNLFVRYKRPQLQHWCFTTTVH